MAEPVIRSITKPLKRAFTVTRAAEEWQEIGALETQPTQSADNGIFVASRGLLFVLPFCEGAPESEFTMRLWAYVNAGENVDNVVWIPLLIAELHCIAGTRNGLKTRSLKANDFLCRSIALVDGSLGSGRICLSDYGSWVTLEQNEAKLVQFDFLDVTGSGNALFIKQ